MRVRERNEGKQNLFTVIFRRHFTEKAKLGSGTGTTKIPLHRRMKAVIVCSWLLPLASAFRIFTPLDWHTVVNDTDALPRYMTGVFPPQPASSTTCPTSPLNLSCFLFMNAVEEKMTFETEMPRVQAALPHTDAPSQPRLLSEYEDMVPPPHLTNGTHRQNSHRLPHSQ